MSRSLATLVAALALAGCQTAAPTPAPSPVVDTSCEAFEPIRSAQADTAATRATIAEHNAAWDALCGSGAAPSASLAPRPWRQSPDQSQDNAP